MAPNGSPSQGYYRDADSIFGLRYKIAFRTMMVFESILGKLLLVIAICSIIYADNWFPIFVNFAFLFFLISSMFCFNLCHTKRNAVFVLPMLSYEIVTIFWSLIWLYASLNAVSTGYLWSLEWLGGPRSSRVPTSHNILDANYANPNETHPETQKAIKFGFIIAVASCLVIALKLCAFTIAKRVFMEIRKRQLQEHEKSKRVRSTTDSEISNLGGVSPSYPRVYRNHKNVSPRPQYEEDDDISTESTRNHQNQHERFLQRSFEQSKEHSKYTESYF